MQSDHLFAISSTGKVELDLAHLVQKPCKFLNILLTTIFSQINLTVVPGKMVHPVVIDAFHK